MHMSISKILEVFESQGSITTDTRQIQAGDLFFALKGDRFNGNEYASLALEKGASLVVVDEEKVVDASDERFILVENVLTALQETARAYRRQFKVPVIGITGTNGKTTTKELLMAVLGSEKRIHATKGNLNNHIGVPLTLLAMPRDIDFGIIEMGANKRGDIKELVEIAEPTHGLVTNIGHAHLERFGDLDGVRLTKGEMYDFLAERDGFAWVNEGDANVVERAARVARKVGYGGERSFYSIVEARYARAAAFLEIQVGDRGVFPFESNLVGPHNAENVLAAVAVADQLGIGIASMQAAIKSYVPNMNRSQFVKAGPFEVLLDAYNANPSSMQAVLETLSQQGQGRLALILGDMFELGKDSEQLHIDLVRQASALLPDATLIGVGEAMVRAIATESDTGAYGFKDVEAARSSLAELVQGVELVVIKGSRGMALERLLPVLESFDPGTFKS